MNIKEWTRQYGFPFKFYKKNGEEVVLLPLNDEEENMIYDAIEKAQDIASDLFFLEIAYGIKLNVKEVIEKKIDLKKLLEELRK